MEEPVVENPIVENPVVEEKKKVIKKCVITIRDLRNNKIKRDILHKAIMFFADQEALPILPHGLGVPHPNKLDKEGLIRTLPRWAYANVFEKVIELLDEKYKNTPIPTNEQKVIRDQLPKFSLEIIRQAIKTQGVSIKGMSTLPKHQLIDIVVEHERGKLINAGAKALIMMQEAEEKEKEKEAKEEKKKAKKVGEKRNQAETEHETKGGKRVKSS